LNVGVKEWLSNVQSEMINTLANTLQEAVGSSPQDLIHLLDWTQKYPAQIVILASQVVWCQSAESSMGSEKEKCSSTKLQQVYTAAIFR